MFHDKLVGPDNIDSPSKWEFNGCYWHCVDEYGLEWVYDNEHFGALDSAKKFLVYELENQLRFKNLETGVTWTQNEYESLDENLSKHADPDKTKSQLPEAEKLSENKTGDVKGDHTKDYEAKETTEFHQEPTAVITQQYTEKNKEAVQKKEKNLVFSKTFPSKVPETEAETFAQYYSIELQNAKLDALIKQIHYICNQFLLYVNYTKKKTESDRLIYMLSKNLLFFFRPSNTDSKIFHSILAERFNILSQTNRKCGTNNINELKKKLLRMLKIEIVKCQCILDRLCFDDNNVTDACVYRLLTLYKLLLHRAIVENKEIRASN